MLLKKMPLGRKKIGIIRNEILFGGFYQRVNTRESLTNLT